MMHSILPVGIGRRGFSLLVVVVILASALLIMSLGLLIVGLGMREGASAIREGGETLALADGCMNEVLLRMHRDPAYGIGGGSIPFTAPNGSCSIQVQDTGGDGRQIDVVATQGQFVKHVRVLATVSGSTVAQVLWEERSD
ncbi:hypothetical protein HY732_03170 [Candidatus Uhrbacteria bacterium]|nr:hypothetical protein [Candidatus Uhrbacteria bacterium]